MFFVISCQSYFVYVLAYYQKNLTDWTHWEKTLSCWTNEVWCFVQLWLGDREYKMISCLVVGITVWGYPSTDRDKFQISSSQLLRIFPRVIFHQVRLWYILLISSSKTLIYFIIRASIVKIIAMKIFKSFIGIRKLECLFQF